MSTSPTLGTLGLALLVVAATSTVSADTFTADGEKLDGVYVRESDTGYFVSNPVDGSVQYFAKSSDAGFSVELSPKGERAELAARWRQARQARSPKDSTAGIRIDSERLAELYRDSDKKRPSGFTDAGTPILSAKGNAKPNPATRARIQANIARMRGSGGAGDFQLAPQRLVTGGGGGGGQGGAGQGGVGQGGGGQGGAGQGGGQFGGFTNISNLFFTINDLQVGETPNLITGFGAQGGQAGGLQGAGGFQGGAGQVGGFN